MSKIKFHVGSLVKASPRLVMTPATTFHASYSSIGSDTKYYYYPYKYRKLEKSERYILLDSDVGVIMRVEVYGDMDGKYLYQVRFMQTGLDLVVSERELKWAK